MMAEELDLQEYCSTTVLQKNMPGETGERKDAGYSVVFIEKKLNHGEVNNSEYPSRPIFHEIMPEYHAPRMMHEAGESANEICSVPYLLKLNNVEQENAKQYALPQQHEINLEEPDIADNPEVPNKHLKELEEQEEADHSTVPHNYKIKLEEHHIADDPALKNIQEIKLEEHQDVQYSAVPHVYGIKLEEQQEADHLVIENTQEIKLKEQENGKCPAVAHYHEINLKGQQDYKYLSVPHPAEIKRKEQEDTKYPARPHIHEIKIEEDQKAEDHASLSKEFSVLAILHKTMPNKVKYAENPTQTNLHKMNYKDDVENTTPPIANDFVTKEEKDTTLLITPVIAKDVEASALLIDQPIVSDKLTEAEHFESPIFQKIREHDDAEFPVPPIENPIKPEVINTESGDSPTYYELTPKILNVRIYSTFDDEWDSASDNDDTEDKFFSRIKGREYYKYYQKMKVKEYHTLYPHGKITLPLGAVLHFWTDTDNLMREDIKEALLTLGADIAFIDYQMGANEGWVRLKEEFTAQVILKKMKNGKLKIAESDVFFSVLTGKEQCKYLKRTAWDMLQFRIRAKGLRTELKKHGYKYVKKFHD